MRSRGLARSLVPIGLAASTIGTVALSTTAIGLTTATTTATTGPLQLVAPTTTRPSSAPPTTTSVPTTTTIAPVLVQPTATTTTTLAPPTVPPVIVDVTTTTVTAPTTEPPATTTTPPLPARDVFVEDLQVTQGLQDNGRMPLVAGKSSTWVRVSVGHSGGGDPGAVDGTLLVESAGRSPETLPADDGPEIVPGGRRTFRFRLEPHHLVAGELKLSFTLFRPDGTPVDDSPDNNSIARVVEFHAARVPTLFVFVPHDLDPAVLAELLAEVSDSMIATLPAAAIDVELLPIPQTASDDAGAWREVVPQIHWTFEQLAEPGDQPLIIGRLYDPADDTGGGYGVFRLVSSRPSDGFEYPGDYAQRFDELEYCITLDALGVPCEPADLGLASSAPAPRCVKEIDRTSVLIADGALLQGVLDCIDDGTSLPPGPVSEHAEFIYSSISSVDAAAGGWIMASGELAADGGGGSIGTMTFSDELPAATALRLGGAVEAAFTGSDALTAYLRLVDADGRPLVGAPASSPYLQLTLENTMVSSYSVDGAAPPTSYGNVDAGFIAPIPWVDGAVALEIVAAADGTVLDSMPIDSGTGHRSGSDQTATVGSNQTITVGASQSVTVGWDAATVPDGSAVDVLWSADGSTWIPVALGITGSEVILENASYLPRSAGDEAQVMIVPGGVMHSDDWGIQGGHEPFRVPTAPPLLVIAGVPDEPIDPFEPIELHVVVATSALQGDPVARYHLEHAWPSAPDAPPAHTFDGRLLTARDLPPGEHVITFTVIDSATGLSVSKNETITVSGGRTESIRSGDVASVDIDT